MTDDPTESPATHGRRYSEREVALIIRQASELQQAESPAEVKSGMSLPELEEIAREAGIDPQLVRRAASNLDSHASDERSSIFLGAPSGIRLERLADGELSPDDYEGVVSEIQRTLGEMGTASTLGRTLQWMSAPVGRRRANFRSIQVTLAPRNGRTAIRVEEPLGSFAGRVFGGVMGGVGMGMLPLAAIAGGTLGDMIGATLPFQVAGAITAGVALLGGTYLLARTIFVRATEKRERVHRTLMDALVERVEQR